jgi:hypothetical protein
MGLGFESATRHLGWFASGNARALESELRPNEELLLVLEAAELGGIRMGLLALTSRRLIFVKERLLRRAMIRQVELDGITSVTAEQVPPELPYTGVLAVTTADEEHRWRSIRPASAADELAEAIRAHSRALRF